MKSILVKDVFTPEQIKKAQELKKADLILKQITRPNIDQINHITGIANDPYYWAHVLEYAVTKGHLRGT
jgi:hypothetical protein